jgi:hypothetical protein
VPILEPGESADFLYGFRAIEEGETLFAAGTAAWRGSFVVRRTTELACQVGLQRLAPQGGHTCRNVAEVSGVRSHLIRFYEHPPYFPEQGHGWVELVPGSGPQAGQPLFFGRYPGGANFFSTLAAINDDSGTKWEYRVSFAVTADQYNAAAAYLNAQLALDTRELYRLLSTNCIGLIEEVAAAAEIDTNGLGLRNEIGVPEPFSFHQSLEILYLTNASVSPGGGIVEKNPNPPNQTQGSGSTPETRCSYQAIADQALAGQATLAARLDLEFHKVELPEKAIEAGDACSVEITNLSMDAGIVLVDFGDGSEVVQNEASSQHVYSQPGDYHARVITVDSGAVREWTFDVAVGAGGGSCQEEIAVPEAPPSGWTPPLLPPQTEAVEPLVEDVLWGDQNCSGTIDPADATGLLLFVAEVTTADVPCAVDETDWRDVDCDAIVDAHDALFILLYLADIEPAPASDCPVIGAPP